MTRRPAFGALMFGVLTLVCGPTETTDSPTSAVATGDQTSSRSIPSSLAAGLPTAVPGAVGYPRSGWRASDLPWRPTSRTAGSPA